MRAIQLVYVVQIGVENVNQGQPPAAVPRSVARLPPMPIARKPVTATNAIQIQRYLPNMLQAQLRIRIEWSHCDAAKIIFNPHYYIWMDNCTHSLLRVAGLDASEHLDDPDFKACPLVTSSAQFHHPAVLGDLLLLTSSVSRFGNTSFEISHSFSRDNTVVCSGTEVRVWGGTDDAGNLTSVPVPDWIRDNLSACGTHDVSP